MDPVNQPKNTLIACHYFRLPRPRWELILTRLRQLGIQTLFTPLPWLLHEPQMGRFDLTGLTNPRRDLVGFVDLCAAMGFSLHLDLSPTAPPEAGLLHQGLPGWLLHHHPEIQPLDDRGDPLPGGTPAHPTLLEFARRWLEQVSQTLREKQASAGPITAVQLSVTGSTDQPNYNQHLTRVQWPLWLRKQYAAGGVAALNAAYHPPTSFETVGQIPFDAPLDSPAFQQDRRDFATWLHSQTQQTYTQLLSEQGWTCLVDPIDPPPHAFQSNPEPADVGKAFQWAMDAPLQADGSPRSAYWRLKETTPAVPTGLAIYRSPGVRRAMRIDDTITTCFRLLMNGELHQAPLNRSDERTILTYVGADELGETDRYLCLTNLDASLDAQHGAYLASLLTGQIQALQRSAQQAETLAAALQMPATSAPQTARPPLTETEQGLVEANQALQRAATSIGALEDLFAAALNKPETVIEPPLLLALDVSHLGPVRESCRTAAAQLSREAPALPAVILTVAQYQRAYSQITTAAAAAMAILTTTLGWLREQLALGRLSSGTRTVQRYLETLLQTLDQGVLRT